MMDQLSIGLPSVLGQAASGAVAGAVVDAQAGGATASTINSIFNFGVNVAQMYLQKRALDKATDEAKKQRAAAVQIEQLRLQQQQLALQAARERLGQQVVEDMRPPDQGVDPWIIGSAAAVAGGAVVLSLGGFGQTPEAALKNVARLVHESRALRDFEMRIRGAIAVQMSPGVKTSLTAIQMIRLMLHYKPTFGGREVLQETPLRERLDAFYTEMSSMSGPVPDELLELAAEHELVYIELDSMWQAGSTGKITQEIQRLDEQIKSRERRIEGIEDSLAAQIMADLPEAVEALKKGAKGIFEVVPWYAWAGGAAALLLAIALRVG